MKEQFTPGPYKIKLEQEKNRLSIFVKHESGNPLCYKDNPTGHDLYNFDLFGAAPDMYATLSMAKFYCETLSVILHHKDEDLNKHIAMMNAALNKANPGKINEAPVETRAEID